MNYAIVRVAKIKRSVPVTEQVQSRTPPQTITDTEDHELRLKAVKNADPENWKLNRLLLGGEDLTFAEAQARGLLRRGLLKEQILEAAKARKIETIPDAAVLAQQVLLTASAEYFSRRFKGEEYVGVVLDERYQNWRSASLDFLRKRFGMNLLFVVEHLDELTPHLVAFVVPLVEKSDRRRGRGNKGKPHAPRWRFNAAGMFGRAQLAELWTKYADATKILGLERPPQNAGVSYATIRRCYAAMSRAENRASDDILSGLDLPDPLPTLLPESASSYVARVKPALAEEKKKVAEVFRDFAFQAADANRDRLRVRELRRRLKKEEQRREELMAQVAKLTSLLNHACDQLTDAFCGEALKKLQFKCEVLNGEVHARRGEHYAVFKGDAFELTSSPTKKTGIGTVEFLMALYSLDVQHAEQLTIDLLGGRAAGAIASRLGRVLQGRQPNPETAQRFAQALCQKKSGDPTPEKRSPGRAPDRRNHLRE